MSNNLKGKVLVLETNEVKEIEEIEIVAGQKILYMTDGSSYHEEQISNSYKLIKKFYVEKLMNDNDLFEKRLSELIRACSGKI